MVRISADSTCDLSPELVEKFGIVIIPLSITVDDQVFKDGVDLTPAELIAHVEAGRHCQTGAVNVYEYQKHFQELTAQGDEVVHISLGSGFSSCYNNALLASQDFPGVKVVDSQNLSTGSGHLVYEAALLAAQGKSAAEIAAELERLVPRIDASFIIDQLDYLARGGRCSSITAYGARILRMKPSIEVRDGAMIVGRKYRGNFEKAVKLYVQDRLEQDGNLDPCRAFITPVRCSDELVQAVKSLLEEKDYFEEIIITEAGCTITNHCGPNTLGVLFRRRS